MSLIKSTQVILTITLLISSLSQAADMNPKAGASTFPKINPNTTEEQWKPHFGLLMGSENPTGSYETVASYGFDIGFQPYIPLTNQSEASIVLRWC